MNKCRVFIKFSLLQFVVLMVFHTALAQKNILVLGVAQDGGFPHIGCKKICCTNARKNGAVSRHVVSLALADSASSQWWLFEATPDISAQLELFDSITNHKYPYMPSGIFITHAHTGHYTGLMHLGKEAMNSKDIPVYVMPKMAEFLKGNGPWSQLVSQSNIKLVNLHNDSIMSLSNSLTVTPVLVPHRDEYSETCGFRISVGTRRYLFIPDINKWELWDKNVIEEVANVHVAFIDGTFLNSEELPGRNMAEIPHPLIEETLRIFSDNVMRNNLYFIHFNHTNKAMWDEETRKNIQWRGAHLADQGKWY